MENPENRKTENEGTAALESGKMNRREFLKKLGIGMAGAAAMCSVSEKILALAHGLETSPRYEKHGWFYTLEEMEKVYESEYNASEKLLKNIFRRNGEKLIGTVEEEEFEVPPEFIDKLLRQLKDMLEQKTAKFLFRLDAFHGHFFINEEKYKNYSELSAIGQAREMLKDGDLGVLYHNSEHGKFLDDKTANLTQEEKELKEKRNVVGWYDGRPIEILPLPRGKRIAANAPGRDLIPYLKFAAHKDGLFAIPKKDNEKEIRLDISFDDNDYY